MASLCPWLTSSLAGFCCNTERATPPYVFCHFRYSLLHECETEQVRCDNGRDGRGCISDWLHMRRTEGDIAIPQSDTHNPIKATFVALVTFELVGCAMLEWNKLLGSCLPCSLLYCGSAIRDATFSVARDRAGEVGALHAGRVYLRCALEQFLIYVNDDIIRPSSIYPSVQSSTSIGTEYQANRSIWRFCKPCKKDTGSLIWECQCMLECHNLRPMCPFTWP